MINQPNIPLDDVKSEVDRLKASNAELLDALYGLGNFIPAANVGTPYHDAMIKVWGAIAKAEGREE